MPDGEPLEFIRIDTDFQVGPWSLTRAFARGRFVDQLSRAHQELAKLRTNGPRVLVMHHSYLYPDNQAAVGGPQAGGQASSGGAAPTSSGGVAGAVWRFLRACEISRGSRQALETFVVDHNVRVILSGHIHNPRIERFSLDGAVERVEVLEARCGTTTVHDGYPPSVSAKMPAKRRRTLVGNSLIVHEIVLRGGEVWWRAIHHWRSSNRGFTDRLQNPAPGIPARISGEIRLYP